MCPPPVLATVLCLRSRLATPAVEGWSLEECGPTREAGAMRIRWADAEAGREVGCGSGGGGGGGGVGVGVAIEAAATDGGAVAGDAVATDDVDAEWLLAAPALTWSWVGGFALLLLLLLLLPFFERRRERKLRSPRRKRDTALRSRRLAERRSDLEAPGDSERLPDRLVVRDLRSDSGSGSGSAKWANASGSMRLQRRVSRSNCQCRLSAYSSVASPSGESKATARPCEDWDMLRIAAEGRGGRGGRK